MDVARNSHPAALPFLFLTEMWERFGFYVVQGLLVLYMTEYFGFSDNESYTILGIFSALVYISPLGGGFIANKILGFKTAVIWGGLFLILGYALLALPYAKALLFPALSIIIVGNGLVKPNVSSLLGTQYTIDNPRRESGFTIFYIGINIGALLAGFSSGYIKDAYGWRVSFGLASIGLIVGLLTFLWGLKYIKDTQKNLATPFSSKCLLFIACLFAAVALSFLLKISSLTNWLLPCVGVILFAWLILLTFKQKGTDRQRMLVLTVLIISSIIFWALFLQLFNSANLYIDRLVDKHFLGMRLTTTVFYASESVFIILLGPIFAFLWHLLAHYDKNPSPVSKFVLGILFAGLGFAVLAMSTLYQNADGLISPWWIFSAYLLITIGELLLSPIGLSAVTMLAPPQLMGIMMGVWFVGTGFGGLVAGWIAKLSSVPQGTQTTIEKLVIYHHAFLDYAYLAFFVAFLLFLVQIGLKKLIENE